MQPAPRAYNADMKLFRKPVEQESVESFWARTMQARGGPIGLRTTATFLGRSGSKAAGLPGLLYTVGDTVWFEDFENDNWLGRVIGPGKKFVKTEFSFSKGEVESARMVSRGAASRCIEGSLPPGETKPFSRFPRILGTPVIQIAFKAGHSFFFEALMDAELLHFLAPA